VEKKGTYEEVLDKCVGTGSSVNPSRDLWGDQRDDKRRRSISVDARKIDDRITHATKLVYNPNYILSSFTYSMSLFEMIKEITPIVRRLVYYYVKHLLLLRITPMIQP